MDATAARLDEGEQRTTGQTRLHEDGTSSTRLIHVYDPAAMAWYKSVVAKRELPRIAKWAHGGLRYRSREGAIAAQLVTAWRTGSWKQPSVLMLYDCTNAFPCTPTSRLKAHAKDWVGAPDHRLVDDAYDWAVARVKTFDGETCVHPTCGSMMGHVIAPPCL